MDIIPKAQLIDGAYYEGCTYGFHEARTARWDASKNEFEYVWHQWSDKFTVPMVYWDETSEYFEGFYPVIKVEPREFEIVS